LETQAKQILTEIAQMRSGGTLKKEAPAPLPQVKQFEPPQPAPKPEKKEDTETQIGKYVLNKIGVISLVGGVAFLIAYTFKYLQPIHKIAIGYVISAGMLFFGIKTQAKEKFKLYARALIAGGWALTYFTTFAMYHIPATRVLESQLLNLVLMTVVVASMIIHLFRYRSQSIMILTLFLGYLTAGISPITSFSLIYVTLLAAASIFLVYKESWQSLGIFSLLGTYITYFICIRPYFMLARTPGGVDGEWFWLAIGFLAVYWIIYNIIPFLIKVHKDNDRKAVSTFVFTNSVIFGVVGASVTYLYIPGWRFGFGLLASCVLAVIAIYAKFLAKRSDISPTLTITAIAFLSASLPAKFKYDTVSILWLIEIPSLIFVGLRYKKMLYRIAGWILSGLMLLRMFSYMRLSHYFYSSNITNTICSFFGRDISSRLIVLVICCVSFYLAKTIYEKGKNFINRSEYLFMTSAYVYAGTAMLLAVSLFEIPKNLVTVVWAVIALILFAVGFFIKDKRIRYTAMVTIGCALLRVIFIDLAGLITIYRILVCISLGGVLLIASYGYTKMSNLLKEEQGASMSLNTATSILLVAPILVVSFAIFMPSEIRKDEIAHQKEIKVTQRLLEGQPLTKDQIEFLNSRNFKYLVHRGKLLRTDERVRIYELALRLGADSAEIYGTLGDFYQKHGKIAKAMQMYQKAVNLDPELRRWASREYAQKLADSFYVSGDYVTASEYYERCLKCGLRDVQLLYNLALCKVQMEKPDEALKYLNSALKISPRGKLLANIYYLIGGIYENKGLLGVAREKYLQSIAIDPSNEEAKKRIESLEKKEGML